MPFRATSPLGSVTLDKPLLVELGDSSSGYKWDVPPGFVLPPGLILDESKGIIRGAPTIPGQYNFYVREKNLATGEISQRNFNLEVLPPGSFDENAIKGLIAEAFSFSKVAGNQKVWFDKVQNAEGKNVLSLKVDDNGQERTLASITV